MKWGAVSKAGLDYPLEKGEDLNGAAENPVH